MRYCPDWTEALFTDIPVLVSKDLGSNHTSQTSDITGVKATLCFSFLIGQRRKRVQSSP